MKLIYLACIFFFSSVYTSYSDDLEIYDLYEQVNGTFYELLEISNTATVSEIRRAYRKRSKELHPDRNKAENAEDMFRQLAAVYEILKTPEKRETYENVLKYGLPDWRQPMYYYRKYRKMGTLEISIIVSLIATFGHYIAWWAAYLEKYYEMSEKLEPEKRKRDRKRRKQNDQNEDEGPDELDVAYRLERDLNYKKPGRWDFLPFVLVRVTKRFVLSIPGFIHRKKEEKRLEAERLQREEEELKEAAEKAAQPKVKRVKQPKKVIRNATEDDEEAWSTPGLQQVDQDGSKTKMEINKSEWTEEDFALLAKVMAKYPGGTPGRWQRIAHDLGRSASDVTKKVKEMKESLSTNFNSSQSQPGADKLVTKKLDINISDAMVTKAIGSELEKTSMFLSDNCYQSPDDIPDDLDEGTSYQEPDEEDYYIPKKKNKVKTRPVDETKKKEEADENSKEQEENGETATKMDEDEEKKKDEEKQAPILEDIWTQIQQKCLEKAIQQFPKSTAERWTCISKAVPGKTKEQCIARYKLIAEQVMLRKSKQSKGS